MRRREKNTSQSSFLIAVDFKYTINYSDLFVNKSIDRKIENRKKKQKCVCLRDDFVVVLDKLFNFHGSISVTFLPPLPEKKRCLR